MTAICHHSMIGGPNCTNSIIGTVMCACAAAVVDAAVVVSVRLEMDRRLAHVAILSLLHKKQVVRCFLPISRASNPPFIFEK